MEHRMVLVPAIGRYARFGVGDDADGRMQLRARKPY
jgi:hypothetical protein